MEPHLEIELYALRSLHMWRCSKVVIRFMAFEDKISVRTPSRIPLYICQQIATRSFRARLELQELLAVQKSSCGIAKFVGGHYDIQIIVHGLTKSSAEFVHCIIEILVSENQKRLPPNLHVLHSKN